MSILTTVGQRGSPVRTLRRKSRGQARYTADMRRHDMLIAGVCFAPHPHARIKKIDVSDAEAFPGVVAVMTAKDLPGRNAYGLLCPDKPVIADMKTATKATRWAILRRPETEEVAPEGRRARPRGIRAPAGVRRSARGHGGWCDPHP